MNELQHRWISNRATRLISSRPEISLSPEEQAAVDRIVGNAGVIAIGEMTHGSREVIQSRDQLLRFLIAERGVSIVVIEACQAATRRLHDYVTAGKGTATESLSATEGWSCVNRETLELIEWVRQHNVLRLERGERLVRVFGCDVQSLDNPKAAVCRFLARLERTCQLPSSASEQTIALLQSLPTDRELYTPLESLLREASSEHPDPVKIEQIQAGRLEFMTRFRPSADLAVHWLREWIASSANVLPDDRFFLERCTRLIEQAVAFYSPDGIILRDPFMAENILAIRKHFSGQRIVVTSHNLHIARVPISIRGEQFVPMGCLLANDLGHDYKAIGSAFFEGRFLAAAGQSEGQDEIATAHIPRPNSFEFFLHTFGQAEQTPDFLLDLRQSASPDEAFPWPNDIEMRTGEAGAQEAYDQSFIPQQPQVQYDGLSFITTSTPITVLPQYYELARGKWGFKAAGNE